MNEPIAVVGSSCRFPGGASSPSKLWQLLKNPRDVLQDIPKDRLGLGAFYHEDGEHHGSTNVVPKAYLLDEDPRLFDGPFFNINPKEADAMDPQQRLLLESVYECIESAGYPLDKLQGTATSVYVGCMTNDYHDIQGRDLEVVNRYHGTGSTPSILSNRISYFFDFRGPSVTLDTACSSSLAAIHFAVQSLRNGESTSSIIGGVNLIFDSVAYISESKLHMLSPTSRSSMWDASADGYARGEGVSALMLKTLSQALADGDHIECIIRETGMNSDGRTTGLTMPSGDAQAALIRQTYARAGLDLQSRDDRPQYFEAHGTGTLAGDPQEARGIYNAFFDTATTNHNTEQETLFCGSIKTVVGHLEGCAGLAGFLKASLAVQHGVIPPNLLFKSLNPDITPFYHKLQIPTEAIAWPAGASTRRASVNSFGFGGTNVHAIIEQYVPPPPTTASKEQKSCTEDFFAGPLVLSASTGPSLAATIDRLADMLEENDLQSSIEELAFFTQARRTTFQQRISFPGGSTSGLREALRATTRSTPASEIGTRAPAKLKWHTPGVLGIFTGQGAQWATMGRDMVKQCHVFRESITACEAALTSLPDAPTWSLVHELFREQSDSRLGEAALSQPLCTAVQIALVDTLAAAGISFRGVVGHSSGEIAATYAAGLLSAQDAMRVAYYRGVHAHLARGDTGQSGAMLAVGLGIDDAEVFCMPFAGRLSVAASNAPTSTTLSGDEDAVLRAKSLLEEQGTFARLLKVDTAYHSPHMLPCAKPYFESLQACKIQVRPQNDECIWISSVYGHAELLEDPEDLMALADEYWVANMCQPVLFSEAVECSLYRAGPFDLAVEVGAHPALKGPASQTISAALGVNAVLPYTPTLQRGHNDVEAFSASLGSLWTTLGSWVDFNGWRRAYLGPHSGPVVAVQKGMPTYSWSHEQIHWKESRVSSRYRLAERAPHELLGRRAADDSDTEMRWKNIMKVNELPWTQGHVFQRAILFPTIGYVAMAIEAAAEIVGGVHRLKLVEIRDLTIPRALVLEDNHSGVETVFSVRRLPTSNDTIIDAEFVCHSSVNNTLEKNCGGRLIIETLSEENKDDDQVPLLPARCPPRSGTTLIEGEAYYQAILKTTGLDYTGLFRGMKQVRRTLGFSTAQASWTVEEVGNKYLLHPGLLDVALQAILAAFVNPCRIPIRGSLLPSALSRLVFDPHAQSISDDGKEVVFESDCFLTNNTVRSVEGDIHVFGPSGQCLLQVEGFRMDNWTEPSASEDRPVFSRLDYQPDIFYADGNNLPDLQPDGAELRLIEAINRASFYYLRSFFSTVSEDQVAGWTWDRQAFYKAVKTVIQKTLAGTHPVTQRSWMNDTAALMESYKQTTAFQDQADMKALHVAGEHLAKVMAGDERPLEVYLRHNVWAPLYSHGRYQVRLNRTIADLVRSFAHRYPRAKIMEVGAGSAGTTVSVLEQVGDAIGQYTFTDVSAGFFEKARERLAHTTAAVSDRVQYKVLDLERDPLEQGFEAESQDVIIAANVLHATADLTKAVQSVRRLLKPGGYLFMLEVTGEYLEGLLLMGPLEGWWLANREGKTSQPGLTLQGWDEMFQNTGFTGVEKYQSDVPDPNMQAVSVVVTQATDARIDTLRSPLDFLDDVPVSDQVLIIGGESLAMSKTVRAISQHVGRFAARVQVVHSVDKIDPDVHLGSPTAVIALCDLERPFFALPVTEARLKKLQALFSHATDVLWVTTGHLDDQDPSAAMMIGLCRTMVIEIEQLNLQFLNTNNKRVDPRFVVEAFVRLKVGSSDAFAATPVLWSNEPELTLSSDGEILIPRLKPDTERNNRLNSAARHITKAVDSTELASNEYTVVPRGDHIYIEEDSPWLHAGKHDGSKLLDAITVRTTLSVTLPHCASTTLITGYDQAAKSVLALTNSHSSKASISPASVLPLESNTPFTAQQLRAYAHLIVAKQILAAVPSEISSRRSKTVIHGASTAVANAIKSLAGGDSTILFTHSTAGSDLSGIRLHARSSNYILQRSLPAGVGFVVALTKDDAVADKLLSIYAGSRLDLDASLSENRTMLQNLTVDAGTHDITNSMVDEQTIPAFMLPSLSASALSFPSVVDWSGSAEHPLQVSVKPIDGRGLFSPDKSYLMVSLVSTLGRSICRWMVENGARHIALASRSAKVDPQWLDEMAHLGADIRVYRMDVSDKASVQSTVATMRAEMPPIAGVANAALVLRDRRFLDMDTADMTEVLAPKVDGSWNLHEEFNDTSLDFFVLFSTLSCVIGNAGQSNYDAASLYQVMLAKQRRQQGLPASVMEVGCVADVGYVAERGQSLFDKLARTMKLPLSESDVHQVFAEAVAASPVREGEVVDSTTAEIVSGMGYYTYNARTPSEAHPPWFNNLLASHYVREEAGTSAVSGGTGADDLSVATRLDATNTEESAAAALTQALAGRVETMLQMSANSFKADASLLDVGIDSLLAVELRTWFLKEIHVDVPVLKILSGDSGEAICAFAASQYLAEKNKTAGGGGGTTPPPLASGALSQDMMATSSDSDMAAEDASNSSDIDTPGSSDVEDSALATSISSMGAETNHGHEAEAEVEAEAAAEEKDEKDERGEDENLSPPATLRAIAPMTHAQARLWTSDHISSSNSTTTTTTTTPQNNNNLLQYHVQGFIHIPRLRRAIETVIAHHEGLHTCFFHDATTNSPRQGLLDSSSSSSTGKKSPIEYFKHIPFTAKNNNNDDKETLLKSIQSSLLTRKWRLHMGEILSIVLLSHSHETHTLLIGYHHIGMDGSAWRIFFRDLNLAYRGVVLPPSSSSLGGEKGNRRSLIEVARMEQQQQQQEEEENTTPTTTTTTTTTTSMSSSSKSKNYWKTLLSPPPSPFPLLEISSVKTRPVLENFTNNICLVELDAEIVQGVNSCSRSLGVTAVNFYLASVQFLLSRLLSLSTTSTSTGCGSTTTTEKEEEEEEEEKENDFCIGITDSGRDPSTAETIGFFLNLLPLRLGRTRKNEIKSFGQLVRHVNTIYRAAREHSHIPFNTILEQVGGITRDPTCPPLFQIGFDIRPGGQSAKLPLGENTQMTIQETHDSTLPYDLAFCVTPMPVSSGPSFVQVVARQDLYSREATELLAQMYVAVITNVVRSSSSAAAAGGVLETPLEGLRIYPTAGIQRALKFGAPREKAFEEWPETITGRVDEISRHRSTTVAMKDVSGSMTYAELSTAVTTLSGRLLPYRGQRIAVLVEPQREWVIGMLSILRAGATFISLDATLPPARLGGIIRACEPSVILAHAATTALSSQVLLESGPSAQPSVMFFEDTQEGDEDVGNFEDPSKASFIICTSGTSTGVPKAILMSSRGFLNNLANRKRLHDIHADEVVLQKSGLGFDMAIAETLMAITHGGTLVIAPQASRGDPVAMTDLMVQEQVTMTFACPTEYLMWIRHCSDTLSRLTRWRLAECGGEKLPKALRRALQTLRCHPVPLLIDAYGPAEVTICATLQCNEEEACSIDDDDDDGLTAGSSSVGRPLANVGVFIVDSRGHICPPGIPGEICITGVGVALGYVDAKATAKAFVENFTIDRDDGTTLSMGRMYKTGDRGVWRADGTLGYLSRMSTDTMVKIRGQRVDMSDVETAILSEASDLVSEAVVTHHEEEEDAFLVAHVVLSGSTSSGGQEDIAAAANLPPKDDLQLDQLMQNLALPRYMKPARVNVLEKLPLTANGKVDRHALARNPLPPRQQKKIEQHRHDQASSITTLKEVELHLLWQRVLRRVDIPRHRDVDFWAMGGSSLHMVKLQAAVRTDMLVQLSIRDMFMHSTLGSMSDLISNRTAPTSASINWDQETEVPSALRLSLASAPASQPLSSLSGGGGGGGGGGGEVLMTGADGFLGRHILFALLRNPSIRRVHCLGISSSAFANTSPDAVDDSSRLTFYEESSLQQQNFGLTEETITTLMDTVDGIIIAGAHGHCLNNYLSLRRANVTSTKTLAAWAARRRIPLHFISSNRVTLLQSATTALPPVSLHHFPPHKDGSEGFTASKWVGEVFLERLAAAAAKGGGSAGTGRCFPITIHRPCAVIGSEAPSEDSLNAILKFSRVLQAVPKLSSLPVKGYFDFARVEDVAAEIAGVVMQQQQAENSGAGVQIRHHSSGVQVPPSEFRAYMEKVHGGGGGGGEFGEVELEEWIEKALSVGLEPMIAVYLRAVVESGRDIVFPYMGEPLPVCAV